MFSKKNNIDFSEENRYVCPPSYMIIETLKFRSRSTKSNPLLSPPNDVIVCGHWSCLCVSLVKTWSLVQKLDRTWTRCGLDCIVS